MDSPPVHNDTDFVAEPHMLVGKQGERLVMVVKATFLLSRGTDELELVVPGLARGVRGADLPWGEPELSSTRYPSDLCIQKPGTDVIVVAEAHAPDDEEVESFDAGVRVGSLDKTVRVFGLRVWEADGAGLSAPRPTKGLELRYDFAWGGIDLSDLEHPVEEPRNPVGRGIARDPATLTHQLAPAIEDVAEPIHSASTRPPPAGLGAIGRHWEPRRKWLGTYDDAWLTERAPLLPLDHDDRANLCASPGLTAVPPLGGGEDAALLNLTPGGGAVTFRLPKIRVSVTLEAKQREPEVVTPYLDTVLIDTLAVPEPGDVIVELAWRAAFRPPRRLKNAELFVSEEDVS